MADVFFDNPPILNGQERQQLQQVYAYLNTMSEKLNQALMNISIEQLTPEVQTVVRNAGTSQSAIDRSTDTLKSMIIKTAEIVRTEMEELRTQLHGEYEAVSSQFGTYTEDITNTITATAEGVLQQYQVIEKIQGLETENDDFLSRFNSYIFMGEIDPVNHITGIAVGDGLSVKDGNISNKMATFTKDRLSFWQGNVEVAYFSNNVFNIENGEIGKTLVMGNHIWQVLPDGSIALIARQGA